MLLPVTSSCETFAFNSLMSLIVSTWVCLKQRAVKQAPCSCAIDISWPLSALPPFPTFHPTPSGSFPPSFFLTRRTATLLKRESSLVCPFPLHLHSHTYTTFALCPIVFGFTRWQSTPLALVWPMVTHARYSLSNKCRREVVGIYHSRSLSASLNLDPLMENVRRCGDCVHLFLLHWALSFYSHTESRAPVYIDLVESVCMWQNLRNRYAVAF